MFAPVKFTWRTQQVIIEPERRMGAIAIIEEHISLLELCEWRDVKKTKLSTLTKAFGDVLRYAGIEVTDMEVYSSMFEDGVRDQILSAVTVLLALILPPSMMMEKEAPPGNVSKAADKSTSRPSTARLSSKRGR